jgi:predicted nucleotidyltransferase
MARKDDDRGKAFSRLPTKEDIKQISEALQRYGIKYVLVGGLAINFHGRPRMTHDIDLLIDPSPDNLKKLKEALSFLPDNAIREVATDDLQKYTVVRIADEVVIDLIGKIGDVDVHNAGIEVHEIDGIKVFVADIDTLIKTKKGLREKDNTDLSFLLLKRQSLF